MTTCQNKVALITGASRGIGKAIALHLAKAGAKVAITGRDPQTLSAARQEIEEAGGVAVSFQADASNLSQAKGIVAQIEQQLGPIDLLVNNAGVAPREGELGSWDLEAVWKSFETNVGGPIAYTDAALASMIKRQTGAIINMGSYAAILPRPSMPAYATTKAALARFSDSIAEAVRDYGINVFAISPGLVRTDMTNSISFFDDVPPEAWSPIEKSCELVHELFTGDYSSLSGRFIHVKDDLESLAKNAERIRDEALYQLRLPGLEGLIS